MFFGEDIDFSSNEVEHLLGLFFDQAARIIKTAFQSLLTLEERPSDAEAFAQLQRALHTLKGDANSIGFTDIGRIANCMEDLIATVTAGGNQLKGEALELLLTGSETMEGLLKLQRDTLPPPVDSQTLIDKMEAFIDMHNSNNQFQ